MKIPQIQQLNNYLGKLRSVIGKWFSKLPLFFVKLRAAFSKLPSVWDKLCAAFSKLPLFWDKVLLTFSKIPLATTKLRSNVKKMWLDVCNLFSNFEKAPTDNGEQQTPNLRLSRKHVFRVGLVLMVLIVTTVLIFAQTVAWQTNVVHTGGLMFSANTWDFSADVSIASQNALAFPGDSGVIDIQMSNDSADLAAASIKVSKEQINEKMRSRIFFYVDTSLVRNGETVNRIYINDRNSYMMPLCS